MKLLKSQKTFVGIQIDNLFLKVTHIEKNDSNFIINKMAYNKIPDFTISTSFKNSNIINYEQLNKTALLSLDLNSSKIQKAGLSLSDQVIKYFIYNFKEIPEKKSSVVEMLTWWIGKKYNLPKDNLLVSYEIINTFDKEKQLLISAGMKNVINEYVAFFEKLNLDVKLINSAGINQFNLYCKAIDQEDDCIIFLGGDNLSITLFIFSNNKLVFFKTFINNIKTGKKQLSLNIVNTINLFFRQKTELKLKKIYTGNQIKELYDINTVEQNYEKADIIYIDEKKLVECNLNNREIINQTGFFSPAITAAKSADISI